MTHIYDLLDIDELRDAIEAKHVREQFHPTEPLAILNYSDLCAFSGADAWNDTTLQCRGLIYNTANGEVVARPFPKFFNYGQPGAAEIPLTSAVSVTDKADGSLGILYPLPSGGYAIATRGSFTSDQAVFATDLFNAKYAAITRVDPDWTTLVEIVAPWNRIVLDYGDTEDLYLLGAVSIETGGILEPAAFNSYDWPGPKVETFAYTTLAEALQAEPRPNAEGLVVRRLATGEMQKIKQADYVALHRILTNTSARSIWEFMAVNACKHLIEKEIHWGSFLGLDPARAVEILAVEGDWTATILDGVPDEFYAWVRTVIARIDKEAADAISEAKDFALRALMQAGTDRLALFKLIEPHPFNKSMMRMAIGGSDRDLFLKAWRSIEPGIELPFARSEDAA